MAISYGYDDSFNPFLSQSAAAAPAPVNAPAGQSLPGLSFHPLKQIYTEELRRAGFGGYSDAEQTKPVGGLDLASASLEQLEAKLREIGKNPEQVVQEFRNDPGNAKLFPPGYGNVVDDPVHGKSLTMIYQPEWDEDDVAGGLILKAMMAGVGGLSGGFGLGELFGSPPIVDDPWGIRQGAGYAGNRLSGIPGIDSASGLAEGAFPGAGSAANIGGSIIDPSLLPGAGVTSLTGLGEGSFPGTELPGPDIIDPTTLPRSTVPTLPTGPLGEPGFPGTEPVGPDIVDPATLPSGNPVIPPMPPAPPVDPTGGEPPPPPPAPGTPDLRALLTSLGLTPAVIGALLGGLAGAAGGGSSPAGTTTTVQDIPEWLKPYVISNMERGRSVLDQLPNSGPLMQQAQDELGRTIGGEYLESNPALPFMRELANYKTPNLDYLIPTARGDFLSPDSNPWLRGTYDKAARAVSDTYLSTTQPRTDTLFNRAGAFGPGNSSYEETVARNRFGLGENLSGLATNIYGGNYQNERGRMLQASQLLPQFSQSEQGIRAGGASGLGSIYSGERGRQTAAAAGAPGFATQRSQAALSPFTAYSQLFPTGLHATTSPYFSNPMGNVLGGALTGYTLGNIFKPGP